MISFRSLVIALRYEVSYQNYYKTVMDRVGMIEYLRELSCLYEE